MPSLQPRIISISIPTDLYFASGLRNLVESLLRHTTKLSGKWINRMQSVLDELCNNAIEHGTKPGDMFEVEFGHYPEDRFEIAVSDRGNGKNKMSPVQLEQIISAKKEELNKNPLGGLRGRGLPKIVTNWTDELFFEKSALGGVKVRAVKKYKPEDLRAEGEELDSAGGKIEIKSKKGEI